MNPYVNQGHVYTKELYTNPYCNQGHVYTRELHTNPYVNQGQVTVLLLCHLTLIDIRVRMYS